MASQQHPYPLARAYLGFHVRINDVAAPPDAKRSRYNTECKSVLTSYLVMESKPQFVYPSMFPYSCNLFLVKTVQTPFSGETEVSAAIKVDYPRPIFWKYSHLVTFALLKIKGAAKIDEIAYVIIDNFPFFKTNRRIGQSIETALKQKTELFKKIEFSHDKRGHSWILIERSRGIYEIQLLCKNNKMTDVKYGMKNQEFDALMFKNTEIAQETCNVTGSASFIQNNELASATAIVTVGDPINIFEICK